MEVFDKKVDLDVLKSMGTFIDNQAQEQVRHRFEIEQRWLEDLRAYNGEYDAAVLDKIRRSGGSDIFVGFTRNKTNTAEARLMEMLFPTDDKNWSIRPTPVPELDYLMDDQTPVSDAMGNPLVDSDNNQVTHQDLAIKDREEAQKRAKLMTREMDDQLKEAQYSAKAREVIHDSILYGTGILKGPMVVGKEKKAWYPMGDVQVLSIKMVHKPFVERVDPWNFFPDMSARSLDECEFVYERHLMTRKQVKNLLKRPDFIKEALTEVLKDTDPAAVSDHYTTEMRRMSGLQKLNEKRYEVWEYWGPIPQQVCDAAGVDYGDDPWKEKEGTMWVVGGTVVKAVLNPLETEDRPYSVYNWDKDDTSIFGFGVPRLMKNAQKVINASWRMILDNAGLATGPQTIVNTEIVEPADGNWNITPRKLWKLTDKTRSVHEVFSQFNIDSRMGELQGIFERSIALADDETALPRLISGEGNNVGQIGNTATGMSLLVNNANIVLSRAIKNWDDNVTETFIRRLYDWNMQFSSKNEIKGDYEIDARGTSHLLMKEVQARNIINLMQMSMQEPYAPLTDFEELYKKALMLYGVPEGEIIKSQEKIAKEKAEFEAQMENSPPPPEAVDMQMKQMQLQLKEAELQQRAQEFQVDSQLRMAEIETRQGEMANRRELELAKMAYEQESNVAQMQSKLGVEKMKLDTKRELFNAEALLKARMGSGI